MYPNLRAEMARKRITMKALANLLGVDPSTMTAKMNEPNRMKLSEARKIYKEFFPELDFTDLFYSDETGTSKAS
ncbi:helix-turn-helix domain-containing protein [Anaerotignum sp.]|uniref:helix-turn-helix domain-containing protein n=1 Tax=Anaerotignum sp. TaxID=2039241 RepID=UPI0028AFDA5B|nr:helix-turn-helix domain-containing protein [Anaerotignum sp.]